jgi:hypothetical protein
MRKAVLALCLGLVLPLGGAGAASADVPPSELQYWESSMHLTSTTAFCRTYGTFGVPFQYGAWGDYIDGCTTPRSVCPTWNRRACQLVSSASIGTETGPRYYRVTQNARVWIYPSASATTTRSWADRSCSGTRSDCYSEARLTIAPGQAVTTQCNGVREHVTTDRSWQHNSCYHTLTY